MGFSRPEYWSGLQFPSQGDLPNPGIEPRSPTLQADALTSEPPGKPFISSRSLLNLSCIFSILVSRLFICDAILFSRFWIIFTIIIWNSLSGRFAIYSSFVWFGGHLYCSFQFSFSSVAQSCPTLCDPMNCSMPGLPVYHHLPEFTQTHVHRVSDAIQPSHPLSSPSPSAPNPSQSTGASALASFLPKKYLG